MDEANAACRELKARRLHTSLVVNSLGDDGMYYRL